MKFYQSDKVINLMKTNYGLEYIQYQAAKMWNSLPDSMRTMTSFKDFKTAIKKKKMNF